MKAIARAWRNEDPLPKMLVGKILRAIEDDSSRARTRMFFFGIKIEVRPRNLLLTPAEAAVWRIAFESSIQNERAAWRDRWKGSVGCRSLAPNRPGFIDAVLMDKHVDELEKLFPVDGRLYPDQVIPHGQSCRTLLRLHEVGERLPIALGCIRQNLAE